MSMLNLANSCFITSNLPWLMNLTVQVPMQYYSLQHWTLVSPPDIFTTEHHFRFGLASSFFLELLVIAFCFPSSILDTFQSEGLIFQCRIFLPFHTAHGVLLARILEQVAFSSSSGRVLSASSLWPICLGWPCMAWLIASLSCASSLAMTRLWSTKRIISKNKKNKKAKWLSEEPLQRAEEGREVKGKGEKERYTQLSAEFQREARRNKKVFLSEQCKEIEENNRMGKTKDRFKKIRDNKGEFHAKVGTIKDRNGKDLTEAEVIKKRWQVYAEELYKKMS